IYKGLAIGSDAAGPHLYAADFHNNKVDVLAPDFTLEDANGRFVLLVGNFGDGRINAYAMTGDGWEARGHLKDASHHPISIDGLWGIGFGNGGNAGPLNVLYFAAGPEDEAHGLFGSIAFTG
ncbi:MAG: TIGR03118 family protein, partial [Chloroflexota bacterium]|nr:TIGR03118 family protein [Chloroflexota bacterium]